MPRALKVVELRLTTACSVLNTFLSLNTLSSLKLNTNVIFYVTLDPIEVLSCCGLSLLHQSHSIGAALG